MHDDRRLGLIELLRAVRAAAGTDNVFQQLVDEARGRRKRGVGKPRGHRKFADADREVIRIACQKVRAGFSSSPTAAVGDAVRELWGAGGKEAKRRLGASPVAASERVRAYVRNSPDDKDAWLLWDLTRTPAGHG